MKYNQDFAGIQIDDEVINRSSSTAAVLQHDTILDDGSFEIWTAAGGTGTQLTEGVDFTLNDIDSDLTAEAGSDVYLTVAVINGTYHSINLYVTYKTVGDFNDAADINNLSHAGIIQMYAGASAPTGWLICDGSAVSRITYSALFDAIGETWGVGDGSTTFNIPDMRGAAPAGVGTSAGYTQDETIAIGTKYNDQMQGHWHSSPIIRQQSSGSNATTDAINKGANDLVFQMVGNPTSDGTNGTPRTGNVTRGKRVGVNFIIKY